MSIVRCDECNRQIDTDFDTDCYDGYDYPICEYCR